MEGRQSKCNHGIHAFLGCSHFPSCAFKSECEKSTLAFKDGSVRLSVLFGFGQIPNGSDRPYPIGVGTLESAGHVRAIM